MDRSLIGKRAKRKGAASELRFSKLLNSLFKKHNLSYIARRSPRSGAFYSLTPSDIMFFGLPEWSIFNRFHYENKNVSQWDVYGWYNKAIEKEQEIGTYKKPLIIARRPNKEVEFAILNIKDFIDLLLEIETYKNEKN